MVLTVLSGEKLHSEDMAGEIATKDWRSITSYDAENFRLQIKRV